MTLHHMDTAMPGATQEELDHIWHNQFIYLFVCLNFISKNQLNKYL